MYTHCPDCETAFRVTAPALQEAAGSIRCDSCGSTFNAIERLTEDPPDAAPEDDGRRGDDFLDSLDDITGPQKIRIEDTGVEWRVIDADDESEQGTLQGREFDDGEADDTASMRWFIEEPDDNVEKENEQNAGGAEQRYDDNTLLPDNFGVLAEHDSPHRRPGHAVEQGSREAGEAQVDLATGDSAEWSELLEDDEEPVQEAAAAGAGSKGSRGAAEIAADIGQGVTDAEPAAAEDDPAAPTGRPLPSDIDTQFELQALSLGIETTGNRRLADETGADPEHNAEEATGDYAAEHSEQDLATDGIPDAAASVTAAEQPEQAAEEPESDDSHAIAALTEEEMTINMMIDQDLLRLAQEQDFTSTSGSRDALQAARLMETIIMEGDTVRNAADTAAAGGDGAPQSPETGSFGGQALESPEDARPSAADSAIEQATASERSPGMNYRAMFGAVLLALALGAQIVHAFRDSLATYPAFERTAGTFYRSLGKPLMPEWNVKGWQFESTRGSTAEGEDVLIISSRLANNSAGTLPYPLLHLSLTDRWEETVGAAVLQPGEYLDESIDPAKAVPAGAAFTAVVRVAALSAAATGFKLNVCYPQSGERIRCATQDFRR